MLSFQRCIYLHILAFLFFFFCFTLGKDSSSSSSQPEILTVPERIVTVSAKTSLSPSSTISDLGPQTFTPPLVTEHSAGKQLGRGMHVEPGQKLAADECKKITQPREPLAADEDEKYFDYKSVERSFMGEYTQNESRRIPPALPRGRSEKEPEDKMQGEGQMIHTRFQRAYKVCMMIIDAYVELQTIVKGNGHMGGNSVKMLAPVSADVCFKWQGSLE